MDLYCVYLLVCCCSVPDVFAWSVMENLESSSGSGTTSEVDVEWAKMMNWSDFGDGIRFDPSKLFQKFENREIDLSSTLSHPRVHSTLRNPQLAMVFGDQRVDALQLLMISVVVALKEIGYAIQIVINMPMLFKLFLFLMLYELLEEHKCLWISFRLFLCLNRVRDAVTMGRWFVLVLGFMGWFWFVGLSCISMLKNSLLHFYCSCKRIRDSQKLFDEIPVRDLVSWNTLIGGYLQISQPEEVVRLFREMHGCGMEVSIVTVLRVLSACGDLGNLFGGEAVHGHCVKRVFCLELNVVTAMIGMYARNGCMESARKIFDAMGKKDVVSWNCIIEGYAKNGLVEESLRLLEVMRSQNVKPNTATLVGLLSACASSGAMAAGLCIHKYIKDESLDLDVALGTALIDMYLKCGSVEKAVDVFDNMQSKDVKSWTALIAGYGLHGKGDDAIWLFNKMESEGVMPNEVTFLAVLNACSHNGLVTAGKNFLERMIQVYGFSPSVEHYGCIIDLLGRAGLLEEAYELIKSLSVESDSRTWRALLAACRLHGNVELGETVKTMLVELNDEHPTDSILLSGSYASLGRWDDIARMREQREEKLGNKKEAGWSSVQVNG